MTSVHGLASPRFFSVLLLVSRITGLHFWRSDSGLLCYSVLQGQSREGIWKHYVNFPLLCWDSSHEVSGTCFSHVAMGGRQCSQSYFIKVALLVYSLAWLWQSQADTGRNLLTFHLCLNCSESNLDGKPWKSGLHMHVNACAHVYLHTCACTNERNPTIQE